MNFDLLEGTGVDGPGFNPLLMVVSFAVAVLLAATLLKIVLRRVGIGRAKTVRLDPMTEPSRIPTVGQDEVEIGATTRTYRAASGIKLLTLFGAAAVLWLVRPDLPGEVARGVGSVPGLLRVPGLALSGPNAWYIFSAIAFVAFLYVHYIWTYRVELDGTQITFSRPGFRMARHDLRKLDRIEDGGPHGLRLYFEDGRKGDLMKQVRGMQDMINRLRAHLV